ncbi:kinesin-like protein KIF3A isoform X4 [Tigriopus californicus]|uniref:kinesin-like protein KIF3A isoform X4 n=1 Tax=Tigriopus californicus TaxID=6832 RepID=UPI0027D9EA5C|nr:kinesin-like protein KIF3A isoform X4 [Tigriopus californicus]
MVRAEPHLPRMPHKTSPKVARKSTGPQGRTHSGQSTLPPSPSNGPKADWLQIQSFYTEDGRLSIPGSANSATKSISGSIRSVDDEIDGDNINVVVRVRPLNGREVKSDDTNITQFPGDGGIWVEEKTGDKLRPFTFNVVFEPEASQADVLEHSGIKRLIEMAVDGFSTTCFCYGQTGSGKTHTLTGPPHLEKVLIDPIHKQSWGKFQSKRTDPLHVDHGLVFRSFIYLYEQLKQKSNDSSYVIKASYLEIYNEKVIDLLNTGAKKSNLNVRWDKKSRAFVVDNLFSIECEELDDLVAVLEEGLKNRAIGKHNMNEHSSRSHTILTVHIHSEEKATSEDNKGVYITRHGKINFVDLAGSEMTKKTKSEGKTLEEANNINKSLMVLGYCIAQLSSQKRNDRGVHIPYRDSKLTKLLADSLAGNGVTLMIACVSPAKSNCSETMNTLRYAARAKKIKTKPVVVMDPREALIVSLKREVNILTQENNHLRQLLELADSDSGMIMPSENSAALMAQMGLDKNGSKEPLDGRDSIVSNGSMCSRQRHRSSSLHLPPEALSDFDQDEVLILDSENGSFASRPVSQRSHDTLRQVSSLLFIATPATVKRIDKGRLNELNSSTLVDLIKDYMSENHDLRKENQDLFSVRDMLLRDQELVCRENERLLKKLEDVTSVCCRSPIVPVRPTYSAELLTASYNGSLPRSSGHSGSAPDLAHLDSRSDSRSSPLDDHHHHHHHHQNGHHHHYHHRQKSLTPSQSLSSLGSNSNTTPTNVPTRLPPNINKELEKRKIGNSLTNIADSMRDKGFRRDKLGRKGSGESEVSPDELFIATSRKKPGRLNDKLADKKVTSQSLNNLADTHEPRRGTNRKERTKKFREKSRSKERSRMNDASKF